MSSSPKWEVADVLDKIDIESLTLNTWKKRTLYALKRCRTAAMGGHIDRCDHDDCGKLHLSYNSCRNRHCPKCQGHKREEWISNGKQNCSMCLTSMWYSPCLITSMSDAF